MSRVSRWLFFKSLTGSFKHQSTSKCRHRATARRICLDRALNQWSEINVRQNQTRSASLFWSSGGNDCRYSDGSEWPSHSAAQQDDAQHQARIEHLVRISEANRR